MSIRIQKRRVFDEIPTEQPTPNADNVLPVRFLTVKQSAKYAAVSESTIRRWIRGSLRHYKAGKQIRIDPRDLVNFMRSDGQG